MENYYNSLIDINTTMPILAVPIKCSITDELLGAFEVINTRGIEGLSTTGAARLSNKDYEILDFFQKQFAQSILNMKDRDVESALVEDYDGKIKVSDEKARNDKARENSVMRESGYFKTGNVIKKGDEVVEKGKGGETN